MIRSYEIIGKTVRVTDVAKNVAEYEYPSVEDAVANVKICEEALEWLGTPYRNCADIKGKNGGVDCAMLLVRCYVDTGRLAPFDPRPYPVQWHLHRDEERFVNFIEQKLQGVRTDQLLPGGVIVYKFGRVFAHGGISMGLDYVVHSAGKAYMVVITKNNDVELLCQRDGNTRETRFYEVK